MRQQDLWNTKANSEKRLDVAALENYLWDAACVIRGPLDAPKFKDYILLLVFLKRLSDVFEDEITHLAHEFGNEKMALRLVEQDHKLVRFHMPESARWPALATKTTGLGEHLTDAVRAVARENPRLSGVVTVVLLPENLFYNTTAPGIILVLNKAKPKKRRDEILLINASKQFSKGRPKNFLEDEHIDRNAAAYRDWKSAEGLAAVITNDQAARNDFNLSPSRYVSAGAEQEVLPLDEAVVLLQEAEEERAEADRRLGEVLVELGFEGWRNG